MPDGCHERAIGVFFFELSHQPGDALRISAVFTVFEYELCGQKFGIAAGEVFAVEIVCEQIVFIDAGRTEIAVLKLYG